MLALLAVTSIISNLDIVVVVLAGVVSVAAVVLFLCHVKPPVGISLICEFIYSDKLANLQVNSNCLIFSFRTCVLGRMQIRFSHAPFLGDLTSQSELTTPVLFFLESKLKLNFSD